jgi:hypothetical protein
MFLGASFVQLTSILSHPELLTPLKVYVKPERIIGLREMTGNASTAEKEKDHSETSEEMVSRIKKKKEIVKVITVTQVDCSDGVQFLVHETPSQIISLIGQLLNHDMNQMLNVKLQMQEASAKAIVTADQLPPGIRLPGM